jgi:cell division protein FtsB
VAARRARKRSLSRPPHLLRWLAVVGVAFLAFLYYRPLRAYLETRSTLDERRAEVRRLKAERTRLERRLAASTSTAALALEARRLALVKPGERLFIVKGIAAWRRAHRATLVRGG